METLQQQAIAVYSGTPIYKNSFGDDYFILIGGQPYFISQKELDEMKEGARTLSPTVGV